MSEHYAPLALILLLGGLDVLAAQEAFEQLREQRLDESTRFDGAIHNRPNDRRRYLFQYGIQPTLVVTPSGGLRETTVKGKVRKKDLVRAFQRIDRLARRWQNRGVDVLCLHPIYREQDDKRKKGQPIPILKLANAVRPRHMAMVQDKRDWGYVFRKGTSSSAGFAALDKGPEGFAWLLMLAPGKVANLGPNAAGPALEKALAKIPKDPLLRQPAARRVLEAITQYRLDDAQRKLDALGSEHAPETRKALADRLLAADQLYADVVYRPFQQRDLLPDYAERAAAAAELHWRNTGRGAVLRKAIAELRQTKRFATILAERASYRKICDRQQAREKAAWDEYERRNRNRGYDAALARKCLIRHQTVTLEEWRAWLTAHRTSPYRSHAGLEYLELKEELHH